MFKRRKNADQQFPEPVSTAVLVMGLILIGILLILIIARARGLLGIILGALAVILLFYWLRVIQQNIKKEILPETPLKISEGAYDIIQEKDGIKIVAEVPGPEDQIKVELEKSVLNIYGGQKFFKRIILPETFEIVDKKYKNGVLQVSLKKQDGSLAN